MRYRIIDNGPLPQEIMDRLGDQVLATILWNRGYRSLDQIETLLNHDGYSPCSPDELPGIHKAVPIISNNISQGNRIAIYGDYDVDGITSTVLLMRTLETAGADVIYHVPNRFTEGYGMNVSVVNKLAQNDIKLIITCDCGISNHDAIKVAKELGMTVIVTDHHNISEDLVPADVIVNPKLLNEQHPCYSIPGVGVAYLLSQALQKQMGFSLDFEPLQLVALGIVSDVVPLSHENRFWLRQGLRILNSNDVLPAIKSLLRVARAEYVDEDVIGFQIGPRLNAPGRITTADICVRLLLTDDQVEAEALANQIDALNEERKILVNKVLEDLEDITPEGCIVEYSPFWHQGVVGIAAGRLCEQYNVPVVLMTLKEDGITATGSARSTDQVNIFDCLTKVKDYLTHFGGHAKAAGLSCELIQIEALLSALRKELAVDIGGYENDILVDLKLPISRIGLEIYEQLRRAGPYGEDFSRPVFCSSGVNIADYQLVGNGKHTRLNITNGDGVIPAIWWNNDSLPSSLRDSTIIYTIGVNRYQGTTTAQLEVIGIETKAAFTKREIIIEDRRYLPGTNPPIIKGEGIGIFVEGRRPNTDYEFTRYEVKPCETLVLANIPPNMKLLKDIIKRSKCTRLVLAYSRETPPKPLLNRLMGVLKGMVSCGEQLTIKDIAIACEETEAGIRTGLLLLEASGFLRLHVHGEEFSVKLLPGKMIKKDSRHYFQLLASEQENKAFRHWMQVVSSNELEICCCVTT